MTNAGVREALRRTRAALAVPDLRWVREEQFHVTLRFFADLPSGSVASASDAARAAGAARAPFDLELEGLGRFPPRGAVRVVWAGFGAGCDALVALARALEEALVARGFPPEERPFAPHLTLARARGPHGSAEAGRRLDDLPPSGALGVQRVDALVLFRSELGAGAPVHTPVGRFPLPG